jgi:3-oxoacyl-(acyl-carrier-protein) synthase
MRRVVITGMGCVSALGSSARATWAGMREGRAGIGPLVGVSGHELRTAIAGQARDFDPAAHFDEKRWSCWTRSRSTPGGGARSTGPVRPGQGRL